MKILVISDSHNVIIDMQIDDIKKEGKFDLLIHCGDKYNDAEKFAEKLNIETVLNVPGNCDYNILGKEPTIMPLIEGKKFLITHGHLYNVKLNLDRLTEYSKKNKADIVLYGHTHKAHNEIIDNILFFNPGSTIFPKNGRASFGIIEFTEDSFNSRIVNIES